jgi:hypothetical protein
MKTCYLLIAAATLVAATGCNSSSKPVNAPAAQPQTGPEWKVTLTSSCASESRENCLAAEGFAVSADGRYQVAPGNSSLGTSGTLADDEFRTIEDLVKKLSASEASARSCAARGAADSGSPGSNDVLALEKRSDKREIYASSTTEICVSASDDAAKALLGAVRSIAQAYYLLPLGGDCSQAVAEIHSLYAPLAQCQHDSDCTYLDTSYSPISQGNVMAESCELVRDLPAANAARIDAATSQLLRAARQKAQNACADQLIRGNGCQPWSFLASEGAPVCAQGRCKITQGLVIQ